MGGFCSRDLRDSYLTDKSHGYVLLAPEVVQQMPSLVREARRWSETFFQGILFGHNISAFWIDRQKGDTASSSISKFKLVDIADKVTDDGEVENDLKNNQYPREAREKLSYVKKTQAAGVVRLSEALNFITFLMFPPPLPPKKELMEGSRGLFVRGALAFIKDWRGIVGSIKDERDLIAYFEQIRNFARTSEEVYDPKLRRQLEKALAEESDDD